MANIEKRGDTYRITVSHGTDENGKRIRYKTTWTPDPKKTSRQNAAALRKYADEYERKVKDGRILSELTTFREYATRWMTEGYGRNLAPTTRQTYNDQLRLHLLPACGDMRISDFKPSTTYTIMDSIKQKGYTDQQGEHREYSPESLRTAKTVLSSILSGCVEDGLLLHNPIFRARKQARDKNKDVRAWDPEQTQRFLSALDEALPVTVEGKTHTRRGKAVAVRGYTARTMILHRRYRTMFNVVVFGGIRREEILPLLFSDIDFENSCIRISKAMTYTKTEGYTIKPPKTAAGLRTIYLPKNVMEMLSELKHETKRDIVRLGTAWKGSRKADECFVFHGAEGDHLAITTPRKELARFLNLYNKAHPEAPLPLLSLHELRHTNISLLISEGMTATDVARHAGHQDTSTTLSVYAHAFKQADKQAADILERVLTSERKQA